MMNTLDQMRIHLESENHLRVYRQYEAFMKSNGAKVASTTSISSKSVASNSNSERVNLNKSLTTQVIESFERSAFDIKSIQASLPDLNNHQVKYLFVIDDFHDKRDDFKSTKIMDKSKYIQSFELIENSFESLKRLIDSCDFQMFSKASD